MINQNSYSVILPTLNEAGHIKSLILDISNNLNRFSINYEIIIVDDNSTDGTLEQISEIEQSNLIIYKRKNIKKSLVNSLNEGIELAKFNNIIWMDADYSHPPEYISEFVRIKENKDIDLIVCSRFLRGSKRYYDEVNLKPAGIDFLSQFLNKICQILLFKNFTDYTSGFICIKKEIIKNIKLKGYYGDYFIKLLVDAKLSNLKIIELPFTELDRRSGTSKTTGNKFDLIIKCFFYLISIISNFFRKFKIF